MTKTASSIIYQQLESWGFKEKLREIHHNFPNVKIERHIANALVTCINNVKTEFTAYAEVEKVDICIYERSNDPVRNKQRVKVELKYHFAPDFSNGRRKGVKDEVLKDIKEKSCDIFIHVIADRHGAKTEWPRHNKTHYLLNSDNVPIAFLYDQIKLDGEDNALTRWTEPLIELWRCSPKEFNCFQRKTIYVHKGSDKAPPLWLHFAILSKEGESNGDFRHKELKVKDFFEDLSHWN